MGVVRVEPFMASWLGRACHDVIDGHSGDQLGFLDA